MHQQAGASHLGFLRVQLRSAKDAKKVTEEQECSIPLQRLLVQGLPISKAIHEGELTGHLSMKLGLIAKPVGTYQGPTIPYQGITIYFVN